MDRRRATADHKRLCGIRSPNVDRAFASDDRIDVEIIDAERDVDGIVLCVSGEVLRSRRCSCEQSRARQHARSGASVHGALV